MWSLFLAAALAQDEDVAADVACMPLQVSQTVPAANATGVPIDANFALVFQGDCGGSTDWTFDIVDPTDETVLATGAWSWDGALPALATFDPDVDLPADTALVLHAYAAGGYYYNDYQVPFTTGAGTVQGLQGALQATVSSATWYRESNQAEVVVDVTPAADPDHLSIVRLVAENTQVFAPAESAGTLSIWFPRASEPTELCVDVTQIDGHGVESEPVTACGDVTAVGSPLGRGCGGGRNDVAVEPASAAAFLAGLGLLVRRRKG